MSLKGPRPAHLAPLPEKSFDVAPGQVIGGLIYIMDKPVGIEEGMIGISMGNHDLSNPLIHQFRH